MIQGWRLMQLLVQKILVTIRKSGKLTSVLPLKSRGPQAVYFYLFTLVFYLFVVLFLRLFSCKSDDIRKIRLYYLCPKCKSKSTKNVLSLKYFDTTTPYLSFIIHTNIFCHLWVQLFLHLSLSAKIMLTEHYFLLKQFKLSVMKTNLFSYSLHTYLKCTINKNIVLLYSLVLVLKSTTAIQDTY